MRVKGLILVFIMSIVGCKKWVKPGPEETKPQPTEPPSEDTVPPQSNISTVYIHAYSSGNLDIYAFDMKTKTLTKLVGTEGQEAYPYYNGGKVYFIYRRSNYDSAFLYIVNPDGSNLSKIAYLPDCCIPSEVRDLAVSPNGRYVAYLTGNFGYYDIFLYDLNLGDTIKRIDCWETCGIPRFIGNDTLVVYKDYLYFYIISRDTLIYQNWGFLFQYDVKDGKVTYAGEDTYCGYNLYIADFPSYDNVSLLYWTDTCAYLEYPIWGVDTSEVIVSYISAQDKCRIIRIDRRTWPIRKEVIFSDTSLEQCVAYSVR